VRDSPQRDGHATVELVVLGSGGRAPTRMRAVSSYLLCSRHGNLLLDPAEGTLRQIALMGLSGSWIPTIFVSNHHLDHCLGLPSVLEHLQPVAERPVDLLFPRSSTSAIKHLLHLATYSENPAITLRPLDDGTVLENGASLSVRGLAHDIATLGLRWEADGVSFAFVPDTAPCTAALELARGADLLLCQADDLHSRAANVRRRGLMTAREAAELARDAGARRLLLSHFQPAQEEPSAFMHEARAIFRQSEVARDLTAYALAPER
jgi:ribonuclease Z